MNARQRRVARRLELRIDLLGSFDLFRRLQQAKAALGLQ